MSLTAKALLYNFLCFAGLFIAIYFLAGAFTHLRSWWLPLTSGVGASLLAPKFQVVRTAQGQKMFMSSVFVKGVKEIK